MDFINDTTDIPYEYNIMIRITKSAHNILNNINLKKLKKIIIIYDY